MAQWSNIDTDHPEAYVCIKANVLWSSHKFSEDQSVLEWFYSLLHSRSSTHSCVALRHRMNHCIDRCRFLLPYFLPVGYAILRFYSACISHTWMKLINHFSGTRDPVPVIPGRNHEKHFVGTSEACTRDTWMQALKNIYQAPVIKVLKMGDGWLLVMTHRQWWISCVM